MIDPEKLAAFMLVTATTSLVPGQSMLFVMGQALWRGTRAGYAALLGMQLGYLVWWVLAALGLGTLARAYPGGFRLLALAGIAYLAWLGIKAIRHSFHTDEQRAEHARPASESPFRDGVVIAISNPKSLVYMVALLPPFVDAAQPVGGQIVILALVAMAIDLMVGALYILAGRRLSGAMNNPTARRWVDRGVGAAFLLIAGLIGLDLVTSPM